jgi:spore maturation protein SpmB
MASTATANKKTVLDMFIDGMRRGWTIATTNMMPNVVLAFILIRALQVSGLLDLIGKVFGPVMALWGMPGQAAMVIVASFMSMGGGVGVAASLYLSGTLTPADITALLPAIYIMGNPMQNVGRCLGTAEVQTKYFTVVTLICIVNSLLAMWVMKFLLAFM